MWLKGTNIVGVLARARAFAPEFGLCSVLLLSLSLSLSLGAEEVRNEESSPLGVGLYVVVNAAVKTDRISLSDLRQIYLGKLKKWNDGTRIRVAQIKSGDLPERFSQIVIEKPLSKYRLYWKRIIAAGTGIPPKTFRTELELIEYVAETQGAIGYLSAPSDSTGLTVIRVVN